MMLIIQNQHLADVVLSNLGADKKVSILGLAFKYKTPVTEASPALSLIRELVANDVDITVYDPLAMDSVRSIFDDEISYAASIEDCIAASSVCVVTLMSDAYKTAVESFSATDLIVIDCWRQIDISKTNRNTRVIMMGRSADEPEPDSKSRAV